MLKYVLILITLTQFTTNYNKVKIKCYSKISKSYETYYYLDNKIITIVSPAKDSFIYTYDGEQIINIKEYKLNKYHKYIAFGQLKYIYDINKKRIDMEATNNFENYYSKCAHQIQVTNNYNLLDNDLCYISVFLADDKKKNNKLLSNNYKVDIDITHMQPKPTSFPLTATKIKELNIKVNDDLLCEINTIFIDENAKQNFEHLKMFDYDKNRNLLTSITIDIKTKKVIEQLTYAYSKW